MYESCTKRFGQKNATVETLENDFAIAKIYTSYWTIIDIIIDFKALGKRIHISNPKTYSITTTNHKMVFARDIQQQDGFHRGGEHTSIFFIGGSQMESIEFHLKHYFSQAMIQGWGSLDSKYKQLMIYSLITAQYFVNVQDDLEGVKRYIAENDISVDHGFTTAITRLLKSNETLSYDDLEALVTAFCKDAKKNRMIISNTKDFRLNILASHYKAGLLSRLNKEIKDNGLLSRDLKAQGATA